MGSPSGPPPSQLKLLERLVQELSGELEQARAISSAAASQLRSLPSDNPSADVVNPGPTTPQPGRIILDDSDRVRYVSSTFWSHIDHELDTLRADTLGYENDETEGAFEGAQSRSKSSSFTAEADRASLDRHGFLLKQCLSYGSHDGSELFPLASQIPFLLEVYAERVHSIIALPHMPSLKKLLQHHRSARTESSSPGDEALLFSVFYAAICSLDEDEVTASFNVSKNELALKYRIGLEHALAKADFLSNPTDIVIQAFVIFLALARRHDSPKYMWMMTGLIVRMAYYLGLHHDGAGSRHLTPFQVEMQRRVWWDICVLDMRATEDQGTEPAIPHGSYSTRLPSNINDADLWPDMEHSPMEHQGPTGVTLFRLCSRITRHTQEMMATGASVSVEHQNRRLNDLRQDLEREYFTSADRSQDHAYLAAMGFMRIALERLTIMAFSPVLWSSTVEKLSVETRTKLLVAAIGLMEHNHALNSDASCQPWRWVFQTQQHWHAIVYLLLEVSRRSWSSTIERAWLALQSPWLVPARASNDKNFTVLVPVKRLLARARKHRQHELFRLRNDLDDAAKIEREDQQQIPRPTSSTTFPAYFEDEAFRKRWQQLVLPVAATTMGAFSGTSSTASNGYDTANLEVNPCSSAHVDGAQETAPLPHDDQLPCTATSNGGAHFSASEPWQGPSVDVIDSSSLDTYLGMDTEVDFMNDVDLLNFDWNSWFESAKGTL
ncbi:hypothetical protein LTR37_006473 [Vermiconidia calcicola]|uniref:Uncharacterized protein n=1 Tax=Vermiconidia calcicola TaxID=1690605 RepID=A0ACC3NGJ8_9PEZI|nr:hypothetical protein LTR37_006473 [Vermiconidia calcicola]